jgi:hypothetical protein
VDTCAARSIVYASVLLLLVTATRAAQAMSAEPEPGDLTLFTGSSPVGRGAFVGATQPWGFAKISPAGNLGFTATSGGHTFEYDHSGNGGSEAARRFGLTPPDFVGHLAGWRSNWT